MKMMEQKLDQMLRSAKADLDLAQDLTAIEAVRIQYLGKRGHLTDLLKGVGQLPASEKPKIGQLVNTVKTSLQSALSEKTATLKADKMRLRLASEALDVTLPGRARACGALHPVTQVTDRVIEIFSSMGFAVATGPEIEDEAHNFDALNIPQSHPARSAADTFYFGDGTLLRTHTSPVQIRQMRTQGVPIRLISPGRVYRRDSDQTHTPMFHQLEGLVIDKQCTFSNLKGVLQHFLELFFEKSLTLRFRPSYFPFTEPSAEVDIFNTSAQDWLEILGCGMVHPAVLEHVGVDPDEYSGFAFGVGLDRLAMLSYHIADLRRLFENDIRFLRQF